MQRSRPHTGNRRDVNDAAATPRRHARTHRPAADIGATQIDSRDKIPILHREVRGRQGALQHTRAVDEDRNGPLLLFGASDQRLDLRLLRDINRGGKAVSVVLRLFMALLSFVESSTPSLQAQGEQRRSFFFNIPRDNSLERRNANQQPPSPVKT